MQADACEALEKGCGEACCEDKDQESEEDTHIGYDEQEEVPERAQSIGSRAFEEFASQESSVGKNKL